jgi:hypothetical protein
VLFGCLDAVDHVGNEEEAIPKEEGPLRLTFDV